MADKILGIDEPLRVLVSLSTDKESSYKWFAVALEMDVWGFGNTEQEAMIDLEELVATQIEFATGKGEPELLHHKANKKWFDLWDEVVKAQEHSYIRKLCRAISTDTPLGEVSLEFLFQEAA